jgi:hypothetical protein
MPTPSSVFSELVTTAYRKHRKEVKDAVSKNNALLRRLYDRGQVKHEDGGLSIVEPLDYAENSTYQRYSGYDVLNIQASDVLTSAEYQWRQIAMNVTASGEELRKNSGETRIINLVKSRMKNAIRTFKNNFSVDLYSDGTLPNQINGIQALVSDAGTGTVGGINSTTWEFWRNKVQSAAAPIQGGGAVTVSATTIETQMMLPLWLEMVRGDDKPDLIVMDNNYFMFYEQSQLSMKRYTDSGPQTGGFPSLKYKTADVIYDGGSGIPDDHMYFLQTEYLYLVAHKDADMDMPEELTSHNQDAVVKPILWMGNLVCSNRARQGVGKA